MPLSAPAPRIAQHLRRVTYHGFKREDGLWDIEGELIDTKPYDLELARDPGHIRKAGEPVHHMWLRVTVNRDLVVQAIEGVMDARPLDGCPEALPPLQSMVGCSMSRGWRKSIQENLGSITSCTHIRELLFNLATAAFQTLAAEAFSSDDETVPPRQLGQCKGWDFNGPGVKQFYPQFYGHTPPKATTKALPTTMAVADLDRNNTPEASR